MTILQLVMNFNNLHNINNANNNNIVDNNIAIGTTSGQAITSGNNNIILGNSANTSDGTAENRIVIGYNAVGQSDNSITLGNTDVTDIYMNQDSTAVIHCGELVIGSTVIPDQDSSNRYLKTNNNGELEWSTIAAVERELNDLTDVIKENGNIFIANGQDSINQNNSHNNISIGRSTLEDITTGFLILHLGIIQERNNVRYE